MHTQVDADEDTEFHDTCIGICCMLIFLMCVMDNGLPEETQPIVPQIPATRYNGWMDGWMDR